MNNKILVVALAAFVGVGAAALTAFTQGQAAPLAINEVVDGLYMITGSGGNVGVRVTGDGVIVIDDKFEQNYDEIMANIQSVTDEPVKYVLNTHHHGDHSGGNTRFADIAQVIAHKNARTNMLRNDQAGPPSVIFAYETAVFLGDVEVQAHHMGRGHTNGDSVIYFPDLRVVHGGRSAQYDKRFHRLQQRWELSGLGGHPRQHTGPGLCDGYPRTRRPDD